MSSRTIIIFSIFIAVVMVGTTFIFLYRDQVDLLIAKYVAKITICGNIVGTEACFANPACQGIYGPTCPDCQDSEFQRCQKISIQARHQIEQEKTLCQATAGNWYQNERGNFCLCGPVGVDKIFNKTLGCIAK